MSIQVQGIVKRFGSFRALNGVDLDVRPGELLALLGPSGSGKTTLLRILAGLEFPDAGSVRFDGEEARDLRPRDRGVGFVFQHYALFRHMTVFENVAFGLRVRPRGQRLPGAEIAARVDNLLRLVQIDWLADRYPSQLSGGQRQRVALARALAIEPRVLLLDEPFGALDAKVRKELRRWLRGLHEGMHITSVFVTHDQEEALELADRVVVMHRGKIEQIGSPTEVYDRPATPFVFDFLGNVNRLECEIGSDGRATIAGSAVTLAAPGSPPGPGVAFIRPHDVILGPNQGAAGAEGATPALSGRVARIHVVGPEARIDLELDRVMVEAALDRERLAALGLNEGMVCRVSLERSRVFSGSATQ